MSTSPTLVTPEFIQWLQPIRMRFSQDPTRASFAAYVHTEGFDFLEQYKEKAIKADDGESLVALAKTPARDRTLQRSLMKTPLTGLSALLESTRHIQANNNSQRTPFTVSNHPAPSPFVAAPVVPLATKPKVLRLPQHDQFAPARRAPEPPMQPSTPPHQNVELSIIEEGEEEPDASPVRVLPNVEEEAEEELEVEAVTDPEDCEDEATVEVEHEPTLEPPSEPVRPTVPERPLVRTSALTSVAPKSPVPVVLPPLPAPTSAPRAASVAPSPVAPSPVIAAPTLSAKAVEVPPVKIASPPVNTPSAPVVEPAPSKAPTPAPRVEPVVPPSKPTPQTRSPKVTPVAAPPPPVEVRQTSLPPPRPTSTAPIRQSVSKAPVPPSAKIRSSWLARALQDESLVKKDSIEHIEDADKPVSKVTKKDSIVVASHAAVTPASLKRTSYDHTSSVKTRKMSKSNAGARLPSLAAGATTDGATSGAEEDEEDEDDTGRTSFDRLREAVRKAKEQKAKKPQDQQHIDVTSKFNFDVPPPKSVTCPAVPLGAPEEVPASEAADRAPVDAPAVRSRSGGHERLSLSELVTSTESKSQTAPRVIPLSVLPATSGGLKRKSAGEDGRNVRPKLGEEKKSSPRVNEAFKLLVDSPNKSLQSGLEGSHATLPPVDIWGDGGKPPVVEPEFDPAYDALEAFEENTSTLPAPVAKPTPPPPVQPVRNPFIIPANLFTTGPLPPPSDAMDVDTQLEETQVSTIVQTQPQSQETLASSMRTHRESSLKSASTGEASAVTAASHFSGGGVGSQETLISLDGKEAAKGKVPAPLAAAATVPVMSTMTVPGSYVKEREKADKVPSSPSKGLPTSTSASSLLGTAASFMAKAFGASKKAKMDHAKVIEAAATAKKDQEEKELKRVKAREAMEQRRLAVQKKIDDRAEEKRREEEERKRKEREAAIAAIAAAKRVVATKKVMEEPPKKVVQPTVEVKKPQELRKAPSKERVTPSLQASSSSQPKAPLIASRTIPQPSASGFKPASKSILKKTNVPGPSFSKLPPPSAALQQRVPSGSKVEVVIPKPSAIKMKQPPTAPRADIEAARRAAEKKKAVEVEVESEMIDLPEINSEYSDSEDEHRHDDVPDWARSPHLHEALLRQQKFDPDR
ncbi:hypothetical protein FRB99_007914, partial [Tulasnella sp. 403]